MIGMESVVDDAPRAALGGVYEAAVVAVVVVVVAVAAVAADCLRVCPDVSVAFSWKE
jgi:hypothetical protein